MFAGGLKDSIRAIEETGVFAVNIVAAAALHAMNATSEGFARGIDEFARAGVARADCTTIDCPRVADAPATLECRASRVLTLPGRVISWSSGWLPGCTCATTVWRVGGFDVTRSARWPGWAIATMPRSRRCSNWPAPTPDRTPDPTIDAKL